MKNITLEEWNAFVLKNSNNSYSLVVCAAILLLWEEKPSTEKETHDLLANNLSGLSGAQAGMAMQFAKENKPTFDLS